MHLSLLHALYTLCVMTTCLTFIQADDLRTWTDTTGKFSLEAKFIGIEGVKVVLEKADGTRVQIELNKLKFEDRAEAMKLNVKKRSENPFKNEASNPFKESAKNIGNTKSKSGSESTLPQSSIDWAGVKELSIFGSEWKSPVISPIELKITWQPRPVTIPTKDFWDKPTGVVAAPSAKRAVIVTSMDKPGNRDGATSTVFLVDLEKGAILKEFPVSGKMTPLAISPDGTQVIARQDIFGHNKSNILELWNFSGTEMKRAHRWNAARGEEMHGNDVHAACFLEEGKSFYTMLSSGLVTWWNAADLKPTQTLHLHSGCIPALSPDNKILAAKSNNELVLIDAVTGDTHAVKSLPHGIHHRFAFSPDGKKLACITVNKVEIYDLTSAQVTNSISAGGFGHETPCFWPSNSTLLAGHPVCFISPELNVNVWAYDGVEKLTTFGDYTLMLTANQARKGVTLVPARLPHTSALQLIEQAKTDPSFFVLKPGTSVRIDASGISDPSIREDAITELTSKLKANGNPVGSGSVTLVASMEKGKDHEVAYHTFPRGFGRPDKTHTVPGWNYHLKIIAEGRTHWSLSGGNHPPPIIHLKEDETIASHLKQYGSPSSSFFKHLELPRYVAKAQQDQQGGSASLRRSQITASGIR